MATNPATTRISGLARALAQNSLLTESEAVFVFEADSRDAAEKLIGEGRFWSAASAWKDLVAGPPRVAEDAYSWLRPHVPDDVSFEPTPGPGDSDGGDLF